MRKHNGWVEPILVLILVIGTGFFSTVTAKVFSGKVTEVRSANVIVVDYGTGQYVVRIAGIGTPRDESHAAAATQFASKLLLGQQVRAFFLNRTPNNEMLAKVVVGKPGKDVGLELLKAGLAQRSPGPNVQYGYKYGELTKAENEAREAKRGLWAPAQPK